MTVTLDAKDPNVDTTYAIDVRVLAYGELRRDWPYTLGAIGKLPRHTGFYYECTTAGETKHNWPEFPREAGHTLVDGSVVWTCRHPSSVLLPSISSVEWTLDPDGDLAVASYTLEDAILMPKLTAGTAGQSYDLTARVTWSTGQQDDVTVTIPVAQL